MPFLRSVTEHEPRKEVSAAIGLQSTDRFGYLFLIRSRACRKDHVCLSAKGNDRNFVHRSELLTRDNRPNLTRSILGPLIEPLQSMTNTRFSGGACLREVSVVVEIPACTI